MTNNRPLQNLLHSIEIRKPLAEMLYDRLQCDGWEYRDNLPCLLYPECVAREGVYVGCQPYDGGLRVDIILPDIPAAGYEPIQAVDVTYMVCTRHIQDKDVPREMNTIIRAAREAILLLYDAKKPPVDLADLEACCARNDTSEVEALRALYQK